MATLQTMRTSNSWFTLIELLIVMGIIILVIATVAPWLHAIANRDNPWVRYAYNDVVYGLFEQLNNGSSGFAGLPVDKGEKDRVELLPESFVSYFQSDPQNTQLSWRMYKLETQTRRSGANDYLRVIKKTASEYKRPGIYLKKIVARRDDDDATGTEFSNVAIMFSNPTWNTSFYFDNTNFVSEWNIVIGDHSGDTVNEFPKPVSDKLYTRVDLEFYNQEEKRSFVVKAYKDKQFYANVD